MTQTVVITGANRGIGLALARLYQSRGDRVFAACRQTSPGLDDIGVEVIKGIDVTREDSLQALQKALRGVTIDLLINNAGILNNEKLGDLDVEAIRRQFEVNALAPLRITERLAPQMPAGSRLALVTSRMGSLADNTSGGAYGYRMSKAALNMAGRCLAHDLKERGIAVAILHPGMVSTEMIGGRGDISPAEAAARLADRIDTLGLGNTGTFWHANGEVLPW
jgi:NAD(P)-dependent dehydrogenase (short-subunit alcohol dehydrogenase family)